MVQINRAKAPFYKFSIEENEYPIFEELLKVFSIRLSHTINKTQSIFGMNRSVFEKIY